MITPSAAAMSTISNGRMVLEMPDVNGDVTGISTTTRVYVRSLGAESTSPKDVG